MDIPTFIPPAISAAEIQRDADRAAVVRARLFADRDRTVTTTIDQCVAAFASGGAEHTPSGKETIWVCGNDWTDGTLYRLHGNLIAHRYPAKLGTGTRVQFYWCGWYTALTARRLNQLLRAFGWDGPAVSFSDHKKAGITSFVLSIRANGAKSLDRVIEERTR